ncbi:NTP transferase domain-containing protein (plasmid) [Brevundimonas staleyi]|uniref:NTP transferase domain-containing protein n=1 Tax=Brevundimonas staleyi TaxID=74326 RepID=A0ABW0FQB2_9CAUL
MNAPFVSAPAGPLGPLPARRLVRKAVILAAGRGRRMGALTADRPKAALEVGGHALIDWQAAALRAAGVEEIAVVTGHGAAALSGRSLTYIHNPRWESGTQVETLLCARDWIEDEPVIVSYGDILFHPCAPLALLERPGDIVVGYDADHRWLWKSRFGNWLKDSETFALGPGQVLTEIGATPTDIEALDGQFMGLILLTPAGLDQLASAYHAAPEVEQRRLDFTRLLSGLIARGIRVDTAANLMPWMEVDGARDLKLSQRMAEPDLLKGTGPKLIFPDDLKAFAVEEAEDEPDVTAETEEVSTTHAGTGDGHVPTSTLPASWDTARLGRYAEIRTHKVLNAFAVQNWGRSGSTFVQTLFDDHPQVLSTPNFYSRRYYIAWAARIGRAPDDEKISAFLESFRQWWDTGLVDATAGLHRLGPERSEIAGVKREALEGYLRAAFADGRPITRRSLFEAGHLAYALARGQALAGCGLQIMFPVHGEPRGVAAAFLEDYPEARFIHTVREPIANMASTIQHNCFNEFDLRGDALEDALQGLFGRRGGRYGRAHTGFLERPYFPFLALSDQARLLKLEDLHADGARVMVGAAHWLGLDPHPRLTISTWDGRLWWNRPESGKDSRLGGQPLDRNVESRLSIGDRRKIASLVGAAPAVQAAYGMDSPSNLFSRLLAVVSPWRQEALARRSEVRSLTTLLKGARILPRRLVDRLKDVLARERYRARLLEMASGSIGVRKKLPDAQKPNAVRAVLLVTPIKDGWRTRALAGGRRDRREEADRLSILYLDDATGPRSVSDQVFWIVVLTLGWQLARLRTWISVRQLMARLLLAPLNSRSAPLVRCLESSACVEHSELQLDDKPSMQLA